jgi:hypothetical protein
METKILGDELLQYLEELFVKGYSLKDICVMGIGNDRIRAFVEMGFHEGYADCLKDTREGII